MSGCLQHLHIQEGLRFTSPDSSTHLSLLFLMKWFENPVAESWGSRWTGTWECVCLGTVFRQRQCIEIAPMYYGEHFRRAENDVTKPWLVDDLNSQICWTLIGWRIIKRVEDWSRIDNLFQESRKICYEEKSQILGEKINMKWKETLKSRWWWSSLGLNILA